MLLPAHRAFNRYLKIWWQDLIIFSLFPSLYTSISLFFKVFSLFCIVRTLCRWAKVRWLRVCGSLISYDLVILRFNTFAFIIINLNVHSRWLTQALRWSKCLRLPLVLSFVACFLIFQLESWISWRLLCCVKLRKLRHRFGRLIRKFYHFGFLWATRFSIGLLVYHLWILLRLWGVLGVKTFICLDNELLICTLFIILWLFRFTRIESILMCLLILVYCAQFLEPTSFILLHFCSRMLSFWN